MSNAVEQHILNWISDISVKHSELGGFSVCPFAKKAIYEVVETTGVVEPIGNDFELIIYVLPNSFSFEKLETLAQDRNKKYPNLVFLPDGKDRYTHINGIQTNNGKYNLLLCQPREKLQAGRDKLAKTLYYSFWSKDYLEEILKQ